MVHAVDDGVHHLLEAQTHIWNHLFMFINSMALKCAIELRIPEAIHKHGGLPVTLSQLVSELGIPPSKAAFLRRLMRLLTHSGFFAVQNNIGDGDEEASYLLTNSSMLLLRSNNNDTHSIAAFVLGMLDPWLVTPWQSLSVWFKASDSPSPFHLSNGMSIWEAASQTPEMNAMFNEAMASDTRLTIDAAIKEHGEVFRELKSLVDVGGGNGATAVALAKAFPDLKCTVLDLPHVIATIAQETEISRPMTNARRASGTNKSPCQIRSRELRSADPPIASAHSPVATAAAALPPAPMRESYRGHCSVPLLLYRCNAPFWLRSRAVRGRATMVREGIHEAGEGGGVQGEIEGGVVRG